MYNPPHFAETTSERLWPLVQERAFGLLTANGAHGPDAVLVPLEVDADAATLRCHVARPNEIWRAIEASPEVLVLVLGLDHYISPQWYPSKAIHGSVVPTWNYEAISLRGAATTFDDPQRLHTHLEALTGHHESKLPSKAGAAWKVSDAPEDFIARQMRGIVGIEIAVRHIEGKRKLSQNRNAEDREGAVAGLNALATPESTAMAEAIRKHARPK
jgi:transcriptional regulator